MLRSLTRWARALFRRGAVERDLSEEMQLHLDRAIALYIARGMTRTEAEYEARRAFGNVEAIKESARDARGVRAFDELRQDVRYGLRSMGRSPGFTAVIVVTLALGIGVNSAIFSTFSVAMRSDPVFDPATLVNIPINLSYADYELLQRESKTLRSVTARSQEWVVLGSRSADEPPQRVIADFVSTGFFASLGGQPLLGRVFSESEARPYSGAALVVLSERFWHARFDGDSGIVGSTIRLGGNNPFLVAGIMPRAFIGTDRHTPDMWLPLGARTLLPAYYHGTPTTGWFESPTYRWVQIHGRLVEGQSVAAMRAELGSLLGHELDEDERRDIAQRIARTQTADASGITGRDEIAGVMLVFGATLSVLLIACATVTNLMLERVASRRREIALRLSLGARRGRIMRQLMTETLMLSAFACAIGIATSLTLLTTLARSGALATLLEGTDPDLFIAQLRPDWLFAGFAVGVTILCTVAIGLLPALRATRADIASTMKDDSAGAGTGGGRSRLRGALVIAQVALTVVLLSGAGVLVRGLVHATTLDLGFDREHTIAVTTSFRLSGLDSSRVERFQQEVEARLTALSGVVAVTRGNVPLVERTSAEVQLPGGAANNQTSAILNVVRANYFDALGIRLMRGRTFTAAEVQQQVPVVIVSAATAARLWPNAEPINQIISVEAVERSSRELPREEFKTARVIGVVSDAQTEQLGVIDRVAVYAPGNFGTLIVRVEDDARAGAARVNSLLRSLDPNVLATASPVEREIATTKNGLEEAQTAMAFAISVGLLSLIMAVAGLFGLTAYSVAQRSREFSIRIALGAQALAVHRLVLGRGARLVLIGTVIGIAGGVVVARAFSAMLFGLSPVDPIAYCAVILLLFSVTMAACYIPARRATRADPAAALRNV